MLLPHETINNKKVLEFNRYENMAIFVDSSKTEESNNELTSGHKENWKRIVGQIKCMDRKSNERKKSCLD